MTLVISKGLTLDNGTRAAAIAGVSPTLDYRFAREKREIETVSLTDKLTFTGGNQGTFVGSDGFIQRAATNVPRFDHDPLSRQSLGLLSEVEEDSLILFSENFDNAVWSKDRTIVVPNAAISPNGRQNGTKLIANTDNNPHFVGQPASFVNGEVYVASIFAKAGEYSFARVGFPSSAFPGGNRSASFDLSQGIVGAVPTGVTAFMKPFPNGWYRCSITATANNTANNAANGFAVNPHPSDNANSITHTGDNVSGIFIWGAQINPSSLTSYIPTTTATVTRTADSAVIDGTGVLTGTYTLVEKPAGCAVVSGTNINLQPGFTAERVMVFPAALDAGQITAIRGAM